MREEEIFEVIGSEVIAVEDTKEVEVVPLGRVDGEDVNLGRGFEVEQEGLPFPAVRESDAPRDSEDGIEPGLS